MAADPIALQRIKRTGLGALTPGQGLEALEALLLTRSGFDHLAQAAAVSVEWSVVLKVRELLHQHNHIGQPHVASWLHHVGPKEASSAIHFCRTMLLC